jgi:uncharacterized membrane protein YkvA (DUF1232 family)
MNFFKKLIGFIQAVAQDPRIPARDKKVILGLLTVIVSPFNLIPAWIPLIGALDEAVLLALIIDYFFSVLDDEVLLTHYPWDMKSFLWVKRTAKVVSLATPDWLKKRIWKYEPPTETPS